MVTQTSDYANFFPAQRKTRLPGGYMGKILRAELSTGKFTDLNPPEELLLRKYWGGQLFAEYVLLNKLPLDNDSCDAKNVIAGMTGPADNLAKHFRHPARLDRRTRLAGRRPALTGADSRWQVQWLHHRQMAARSGIRILSIDRQARKNRPAVHGHAHQVGIGRIQRMEPTGLMTTRNQVVLALMPMGFVRHSRANGNPGSIPSLDSRWSLPRLRSGAGVTNPLLA